MRLRMKVAGKEVCIVEVWEDKAPKTAKAIREHLPLTSVLQHGKLVGDLIFWVTPIVADWENVMLTEEVGKKRRKEKGKVAGGFCFYGPRQQLSIAYDEDLADEPLKISYIGEVVEGEANLKAVGLECWLQQGQIIELEAA